MALTISSQYPLHYQCLGMTMAGWLLGIMLCGILLLATEGFEDGMEFEDRIDQNLDQAEEWISLDKSVYQQERRRNMIMKRGKKGKFEYNKDVELLIYCISGLWDFPYLCVSYFGHPNQKIKCFSFKLFDIV